MFYGMTVREIRDARKRIEANAPDAEVVASVAGKFNIETIRKALVAFRNHRKELDRKRYLPSMTALKPSGPAVKAPVDVNAERDRRLAAPPRDLTGLMFGDPPLGFSALDRRT
jgi:hypothetical protein